MYLSEAIIPYETAAKMGFHTPWDWHGAFWQCFPDISHPAHTISEQQFLSRTDQLENGQRAILLSKTEPKRPSWCPSPGWRMRRVEDAFLGHTLYEFSLIANPTVTRLDPERMGRRREDGTVLKNSNSRRVPIREHADLQQWLIRQAARRGFEIIRPESLRIAILPRQVFAKEALRDTSPKAITLHRVRFDGLLRISDPLIFKEEWPKGIGRGRAFGNGFLVIIPRKEQDND
jgi:CRISPR system Cascade subunit CasE